MPFSRFKTQYQPEQLAKMIEAFELVWPQASSASGGLDENGMERLRTRLANYIVACASQGEFDPEKLAAFAIRAFADSKLYNIVADRAPLEAGQSKIPT